MIVIRSIIEKGGPGQITCNYHTIIPDTVACTIFNMLFVTFGGGHSALHVRAFIHSLFLSLFLSHFFYHSLPLFLALFFSLENTHFRQQWTTSLDPIQRLYVHKNLFFFLLFLKMLHSTVRIFLLLSLTLSFSLCSSTSNILTIYFTEASTRLEISTRPASRVQERNREIDKSGIMIKHEIQSEISVLPVEELIQTFEMHSKDLLKRQYNDVISVFQVSC